MRNFRNLTIDVGDNPHADGVRWYGNNSSILKDVRVIGTGKVGINAGFLGQNGPNLVQDALVEGAFETGVRCAWSWGQTLVARHRARGEAGRRFGQRHGRRHRRPGGREHAGGAAQRVSERLDLVGRRGGAWRADASRAATRRNRPSRTAACSTRATCKRKGSSKSSTARRPAAAWRATRSANTCRTRRRSCFRKLRTARSSCRSSPSRGFRGRRTWRTGSAPTTTAPGSVTTATTPRRLQAAIDAAAAAGKTVVYLRGIGGGDPNWYTLDGEVRVHGSVRLIIGLGFGRVIGGDEGRFLVDDRSAPVVKFLHLQAFGGRPPVVENRSATNTLVVESCDLRVVGTGGGTSSSRIVRAASNSARPDSRLWARQLNPEGDSDIGLVQNHGGVLWALGVKHEGRGVRFLTDQGGQTEILGLFNYAPDIAQDDPRPAFDVVDADFSAAGVRELSFGNTYPVKARERRGTEVRTEAGRRVDRLGAVSRRHERPALRGPTGRVPAVNPRFRASVCGRVRDPLMGPNPVLELASRFDQDSAWASKLTLPGLGSSPTDRRTGREVW